MVRLFLAALLIAILMATSAAAQPTPDPVALSYTAYRAAIERGDLLAAERAAEQALAASEARDGEGGHTDVLAYNLAIMGLDAGNSAAALAPATRAHELAEARGLSSGVNPLLARLVRGQAELAVSPESGRDRILAALQEAENAPDVGDRAYAAAAALGAWALDAGEFELARSAWSAATRHAQGETPRALLLRSRARTGEAVAMIAEYAQLPGHRARDEAYAILNSVVDDLYPHAAVEGEDQALTPFQAAYAEALAWRDYGRPAYTPRPDPVLRDLSGQTICEVRWSGDQTLPYTLGLAYSSSVGGVAVFRLLLNEEGRVNRLDVASQAPAQDISQTVAPHLERLRAVRSSRAERGCVMPRVTFVTVVLGRR